MWRFLVSSAAISFCMNAFADYYVMCGDKVSCKSLTCSMKGGTPKYFIPEDAEDDSTYSLYKVSASTIGRYHFARCWYVDSAKRNIEFKSVTSHSITPATPRGWLGRSDYKTCDPSLYTCELKAAY